ncbi:MAG: hypothetical protein ACRC6E_09725 [Fusobacteriaceae bacterium]
MLYKNLKAKVDEYGLIEITRDFTFEKNNNNYSFTDWAAGGEEYYDSDWNTLMIATEIHLDTEYIEEYINEIKLKMLGE